jgi:hypothetical protein
MFSSSIALIIASLILGKTLLKYKQRSVAGRCLYGGERRNCVLALPILHHIVNLLVVVEARCVAFNGLPLTD